MKLWQVTLIEKKKITMQVEAHNEDEALDKCQSGYGSHRDEETIDEDWDAELIENDEY